MLDDKLLKYLRKNFVWEVPGRAEAMQYFRAAEFLENDRWPDAEIISFLKHRFSKEELQKKYREWDDNFESNVEIEMKKYPDKFPINRCPKCKEITYTPKSERCGACGHTWYGENPLRNLP